MSPPSRSSGRAPSAATTSPRSARWYNGLLHIAVLYVAGAAAIGYCSAAHAGRPLGVAGGRTGVHRRQLRRMVHAPSRDASPHRRIRPARHLRAAHPPAPSVLHRRRAHDRYDAGIPHRLLPVARAAHPRGGWRRARQPGGAGLQRQRGLRRRAHDDRPLHGLRDVPLLLPRSRQLVRPPDPTREYDPPPPRGASQTGDHDARQHEPHACRSRTGRRSTSDLREGCSAIFSTATTRVMSRTS